MGRHSKDEPKPQKPTDEPKPSDKPKPDNAPATK